jgi:hypothetical protein
VRRKSTKKLTKSWNLSFFFTKRVLLVKLVVVTTLKPGKRKNGMRKKTAKLKCESCCTHNNNSMRKWKKYTHGENKLKQTPQKTTLRLK